MKNKIINKDDLKKIKVIARKMNQIGFGSIKNLEKELLKRFLEIQMEDLLK